jgi:hypothetical protein
MKPHLNFFPYGYKAEMADGPPCYRRETDFGWEVYRRYLLYDDREGIHLSAVFQSEHEAIELEQRIVAALRESAQHGAGPQNQ